MKAKGFTLIELLVVISIIAVLMAILMPALGAVREQAKSVIDVANLKQWGCIFSLYTTENGDRFFPGTNSTDTKDNWLILTRPYYDDDKFLLCPSTKRSQRESANRLYTYHESPITTIEGGVEVDEVLNCSYGANNWLNSLNGKGEYNRDDLISDKRILSNYWKTTSSFKDASKVPMLLDSQCRGGGPSEKDPGPQYNGEPWETYGSSNQMARFCMDRHRKSISTVFGDMSARPVELKELWKLKWHRFFDVNLVDRRAFWPEWMNQY